MSQILPRKSDKEIEVSDPKIIDLGSDEAEIVLDSLSSKTTREVFMSVYDDPSTKSQIADQISNSIQNAKYHIDKLEEANLIESKRTDYSEKGNEMDVYGPTNEAVVLLASDEKTRTRIRDSMKPLALTIGFGAVVSSALMRYSSLTGFNGGDVKDSSSITRNAGSDESVGTESTNSDSTSFQDPDIAEATDMAPDIAVGFIELSPSIAMGLAMITGMVLSLIVYLTAKKLVS